MKIIINTFPSYKNIAHGDRGDIVNWELLRGQYNLIRESDGKIVFATAKVNKAGLLVSNGKPAKLVGVIAENKSKGFLFELSA